MLLRHGRRGEIGDPGTGLVIKVMVIGMYDDSGLADGTMGTEGPCCATQDDFAADLAILLRQMTTHTRPSARRDDNRGNAQGLGGQRGDLQRTVRWRAFEDSIR